MTEKKEIKNPQKELSSLLILDLCGGTGAWSKPYKEAGYDVRVITLPEYDVTTYEPPENVYGILAAPPCTMFSLARTTARTPRDLKEGMSTVEACLRIIWKCQYGGKRLKFWALENPQARLRWFLGKPVMTFQPFEFGDPHSKKTDLWGNFNTDLKKTPVELNPLQKKQSQLNLKQLPEIPKDYRLEGVRAQTIARAITPPGFSKAFFNANR